MEQPLYNMILYSVICVNIRCMFVLKNDKLQKKTKNKKTNKQKKKKKKKKKTTTSF